MKKLALFFIAMAFNLTAYAALPTEVGEFEINIPMLKSGLELGATALFVESSTPDLDYALVVPNGSFDGAYYKSARPGYDIGYQFFLGYIFPNSGSDLRLTYIEYEQQERDHVGNPQGSIIPTLAPTFTGSLTLPSFIADVELSSGGTTVSFPGLILIDSMVVPISPSDVIEADVKNTIRQSSVDLDAGQYVNVDNFLRLRLFSGLRYSRIKNQLIATYLLRNISATAADTSVVVFNGADILLSSTVNLSSASVLQDVISQTSKFDGLGPRFGAEGTFYLGGGFGLVGNISTAVLIGDIQSSLSRVVNGTLGVGFDAIDVTSSDSNVNVSAVDVVSPANPFPDFVGVIENHNFGKHSRVVPNIEAKIGLDYTVPLKNCRFLTLEVGYYVNHFFEAIDKLSAESFSVSGQGATKNIDIGFSGLYFELKATL